MSFESYKLDYYRKCREKLNSLCWLSAFITLSLEIIIFFLFTRYQTIRKNYIYFRLLLPSLINFTSTILIQNIIKKIAFEETKIFLTCLNVFIICAVASVFHNYFLFMLIATLIPILVCTIFGNAKLLSKIGFMSIPVFILSSYILLFDTQIDNEIYKIATIMCAAVMLLAGYLFAKTIVISQANQTSYIFAGFSNQERLLRDLKIEPLTKLSNRIAMNESAMNIYQRAFSEDIKPFMVMLDIDFFKKINDTYGHLHGDEVLCSLSDIIAEKMNGNRNAFRFGGEEFILMFDDSTQKDVLDIVEDIRFEFSRKTYNFSGDNHFTVSAGIAPLLKEWTLQKWFEAADVAMYKAKKTGRDRTVVF